MSWEIGLKWVPQRVSETTSQHLLQSISWANVYPELYHHMPLLGHNELKGPFLANFVCSVEIFSNSNNRLVPGLLVQVMAWHWFWPRSVTQCGITKPQCLQPFFMHYFHIHYSDIIMSMMSQITSLTIVYSTVYSGADRRKHQSSASLAFVRGIHGWPVNSPHKGPVMWKMLPFDDIIMQWMAGLKFML